MDAAHAIKRDQYIKENDFHTTHTHLKEKLFTVKFFLDVFIIFPLLFQLFLGETWSGDFYRFVILHKECAYKRLYEKKLFLIFYPSWSVHCSCIQLHWPIEAKRLIGCITEKFMKRNRKSKGKENTHSCVIVYHKWHLSNAI